MLYLYPSLTLWLVGAAWSTGLWQREFWTLLHPRITCRRGCGRDDFDSFLVIVLWPLALLVLGIKWLAIVPEERSRLRYESRLSRRKLEEEKRVRIQELKANLTN